MPRKKRQNPSSPKPEPRHICTWACLMMDEAEEGFMYVDGKLQYVVKKRRTSCKVTGGEWGEHGTEMRKSVWPVTRGDGVKDVRRD